MLKRTPLYEHHLKSHAKMVPFGPWEMPLQYTSILDEHHNTRRAVTMFDTCHMGEIICEGPGALETLSGLVPRDISALADGRCAYTHLCREDGGIIDDVIIYRKNAEMFMVVVNGGTIDTDFQWMTQHRAKNCQVHNISNDWGKIDLQGPQSLTTLVALWPQYEARWADLPYFAFTDIEWEGVPVLVSRTGYTGELGYEIYAPAESMGEIWQKLMALGAVPAGLGARDTLRLEMGYPLMGEDLSEFITPLDAGFSFWVDKKKNFIGAQALKTPQKQWRVALLWEQGGIPRHGSPLLNEAGETLGQISSGTWSPTLQKAIAMGYVSQPLAQGTSVITSLRGRSLKGIVTELPFVKETSIKKNKIFTK